MTVVWFGVLGTVQIDHGARVVSGRLRRGVLGLLLARPNVAVPADVLATALWGEDAGPRSGPRLHVHVHHVRRALGDTDRVVFEDGGYRLRVRPGELDAARFDELVSQAGATADLARRTALLREALGLWRGRPYEDLDLAELRNEVGRLSESRLMAAEELYVAELACGRHTAAVPELTELAAEYPLREGLHALLMTALHRSGRQADALAAFRRARDAVVDELGLEPGPRLRELERRILSGERLTVTTPQRPAQLPHEVADFVGRTEQLAQLTTAVAGPARIMVITGAGGVGKTAMATRWAHRAREHFPDGQLYVDLRGYGPDQPMPPAEALAGFLRALGAEDGAIPLDPTERAARFRTLLDGRRMLVVLDNAATADQVRPLLPGTQSCFVLVTSRDALAGLAAREGAGRIRLDCLSVPEARDLLLAWLGPRAGDPAATQRLVQQCARLPLALRIAAERISTRHGTSIADLDHELADERSRLDLLDTGDPHASVRTVLSWSYHQLTDATARVFRLCGLRTGHDIDLYGVAALAGDADVRTTRRQLDTLVRAHLVDRTETGRYQQHDLLWAYASELARETDPEPERAAATTRLLDHYRYTAAAAVAVAYPEGTRPRFPRPATPVPDVAERGIAEAWLDANHANLLAAAAHAGDNGRPEHTGDLSTLLARHIRRRAHHEQASGLHRRALTIARTLADRPREQAALAALGHVLRMAGHYTGAVDHYDQALSIARDLGDRHGELTALGGLGDTYLTRGHHRSATAEYSRLLTAARESGARLAELKALACLGHADMWAGRYAEGEAYYRQAFAIALDLGNRGSGLTATLGLGHVHMLTGRYAESAEYDRTGLAVAREVGHRLAELSALSSLAELDARAARHEAAVGQYEEALAIARSAGVRSSEALILVNLARTLGALGRRAEAADLCREALVIAGDSGHEVGRVEALDGLGRTATDPHVALDHHHAALAIADELALPREQAMAHDGIGHAHSVLATPSRARHHWRLALDIGRDLGIPEADAVDAQLAAL